MPLRGAPDVLGTALSWSLVFSRDCPLSIPASVSAIAPASVIAIAPVSQSVVDTL